MLKQKWNNHPSIPYSLFP